MKDPAQFWNQQHQGFYKNASWSKTANPFVADVLSWWPSRGKILELGCGQGQDTAVFHDRGYEVVAVDFSKDALDGVQAKFPGVDTCLLDLSQDAFPWADESFDGVYAHLSLHYFSEERTSELMREIGRVLVPGGVCGFVLNTIQDPEYATGELLEEDFFLMPSGACKRYFSIESLKSFVQGFESLLLDDQGRTVKDASVGDYGLIRFIGRKH